MGKNDYAPEKTSTLDVLVVVLIGVGGAAMIVGNIVILCNRGYRPIKAKSVPLTFLSSVGGLIWIVAALVVNDHFARYKDSFLVSVCPLWTYWLQACFGFSLWLNCLTLRLISLYRIFIWQRDSTLDYYFLVPLLAPAIIFCIVATATKQVEFIIEECPTRGDCTFSGIISPYGLVALLVLYFLIFLGFAFKLRYAMSPFNEFRLIRRGGILSLFLFLLYLVTVGTHAYNKPVGRCLLSAAVASVIFYYFWARNGAVVYNVLFHKQEYLDKFMAELRRSCSQHERHPPAVLEMENQLSVIRAEVQQYQETIVQLEDEVKDLELQCGAMQQRSPSQANLNFYDSS